MSTSLMNNYIEMFELWASSIELELHTKKKHRNCQDLPISPTRVEHARVSTMNMWRDLENLLAAALTFQLEIRSDWFQGPKRH